MKARMLLESLGQLDIRQIIASFERSIERESEATAAVVAHLAVMERDRVHIHMGYPSLYAYCTDKLTGYSRQKAYKRIRAARAALCHPEILDDLESGALSLAAVTTLAKHLTGGVVGTRLLAESRGKSVRQVQALLAARFPAPDSPRGELRIQPVGDDQVRIEIVVSTEVADKLELARELDRHRNPRGDVEAIVSEALDLFVAHVEKKKLARAKQPQAVPQQPTAKAPAAAARDVYERNGGRRTFEGTERICGEPRSVELDGDKARANGGGQGEPNGPLRCAGHNCRKPQVETDKERFERSRARVQTKRDLVLVLAELNYPRAEIRARTRAALLTHGPDARFETLLGAALRHDQPWQKQGEP